MNIPSWWWLATIPAVLALGALYWLFFVRDAHDFSKQLSQEQRRAEYVAAKPLPKQKIAIEFKTTRNNSIEFDKADIDGDELWVYLRNRGAVKLEFVKVAWRAIAPDGTVIKSEEHYLSEPAELEPGEKREVKLRFSPDPRIEKVVISAKHWQP